MALIRPSVDLRNNYSEISKKNQCISRKMEQMI